MLVLIITEGITIKVISLKFTTSIEKLKDVEISFIENQLLSKYAISSLCTAPNTPPVGYDFSGCNTTNGGIPVGDCNVTCDEDNNYIAKTSVASPVMRPVERLASQGVLQLKQQMKF